MQLTCGIYLIYEDNMLICHPTNFPWDKWGIPKGQPDPYETPIETAYRELYEETNILLAEYRHEIYDIGIEPYKHKRKALHGFIVLLQEWDYINIFCDSMFDNKGVMQPEVDAFSWLPITKAVSMINDEQQILYNRNQRHVK